MKHPKCRLCGAEHALGEAHKFSDGSASSNGRTPDFGSGNRGSTPRAGTSGAKQNSPAGETQKADVAPPPIVRPKTDRKEYLKLKARERRKRYRAEADKMGMTIADWLAWRSRKKGSNHKTGMIKEP